MFDPIITAHMRILDNLQTVIQHLIPELARRGQLPGAFALAARTWLLDHIRTLSLHQQALSASQGLHRRVALHDDVLYALCRDQDLGVFHHAATDTALILYALSRRIEEVRGILLGFEPMFGRRPPSPGNPCITHLREVERGALSVPGAMAGLAGWWTLLRCGSIELDLAHDRLTLNVAGSDAIVSALAAAQAPMRHLGGDIFVSWGTARGIVPRLGEPQIICCDASDEATFAARLQQIPSLTVPTPRDTAP